MLLAELIARPVVDTAQTLHSLWHFERDEKLGILPGPDDPFVQKIAGIYQKTPHFLTSGIEYFDDLSQDYLEVTEKKVSLRLTEYEPKAVKIALCILGIVFVCRTPLWLTTITLLTIGVAAHAIKLLRNAKICNELDEISSKQSNSQSNPSKKLSDALTRKIYWENKATELLKIGSTTKTATTLLEDQYQGINQVDREALLAEVRAAFFQVIYSGKAQIPCRDVYREVSDQENIFRYRQSQPAPDQQSSCNNDSKAPFSPFIIQFSDGTGLTPHQVTEMFFNNSLSNELSRHFPA